MIKVNNLSKKFGAKLVVDNVTFSVEKGEVLGFLGPNGAGKSTTMRMVTGFIPADNGTVTICDHSIDDDPIRAKSVMGYLPENAPAYGDMTVTAFLNFVASLRGLRGRKRADAVEKVINTCFLQPVRHQPIETLSKGFLHRTCFAQSIIHDPEVLILDEPTDGLDPNQKHEVRNLIKKMGERKAIIISTHILEEVDAVCSRVIIINEGKLVANGLPPDLKSKSKLAGSVILTVVEENYSQISEKLKTMANVESVLCLQEDKEFCQVRVYPKKEGQVNGRLPAQIHAIAVGSGWKITELRADDGRLDDVFREITTSDVNLGS